MPSLKFRLKFFKDLLDVTNAVGKIKQGDSFNTMFAKLLPSLLSLGGLVLTAVSPTIQGYLGGFATHHTIAATAITAALGIFAHLWPSPLAPATPAVK